MGLYEKVVPESFRRLFWSKEKKMLDAQTKAATAAAQLFVVKLQDAVLNGKIKIRPRKKAYARRAKDPHVLVNTKKYILGFRTSPNPDRGTCDVVNPNHQLFRWLEYGTRQTRARPHVRVIERQYRKELAQVMGRRLTKEIFGG